MDILGLFAILGRIAILGLSAIRGAIAILGCIAIPGRVAILGPGGGAAMSNPHRRRPTRCASHLNTPEDEFAEEINPPDRRVHRRVLFSRIEASFFEIGVSFLAGETARGAHAIPNPLSHRSTATLSAAALSAATLSAAALSAATLSVAALSAQTLSAQTLSVDTLSVHTLSVHTLSTARPVDLIAPLPTATLAPRAAASATRRQWGGCPRRRPGRALHTGRCEEPLILLRQRLRRRLRRLLHTAQCEDHPLKRLPDTARVRLHRRLIHLRHLPRYHVRELVHGGFGGSVRIYNCHVSP
eukprot:scaffold1591_cov109-Isochrysis_galbana.AAC.11